MKIKNIHFDREAMGDPVASLRILRDELARRYDHRISIKRVPTGGDRWGLLILDEDSHSAIFTGDGFFPPRSGTPVPDASRAEWDANRLLDIFGFDELPTTPLVDFSQPMDLIRQMKSPEAFVRLTALFANLTEDLQPVDFVIPAKLKPILVRSKRRWS